MTTEPISPDAVYELPPAGYRTYAVLDEVLERRRYQDGKWGPPESYFHPWNAGILKPFQYLLDQGWASVDTVRRMVELEAKRGRLGYVEILFEEVAEAMDELDIERVREELIDVAATAVAAIESIDRNGR